MTVCQISIEASTTDRWSPGAMSLWPSTLVLQVAGKHADTCRGSTGRLYAAVRGPTQLHWAPTGPACSSFLKATCSKSQAHRRTTIDRPIVTGARWCPIWGDREVTFPDGLLQLRLFIAPRRKPGQSKTCPETSFLDFCRDGGRMFKASRSIVEPSTFCRTRPGTRLVHIRLVKVSF